MTVGVLLDDLCIRHRIARPHAGYPESEARYLNIAEFEEMTGYKLVESYCDNCGYANGVCPSCVEKGQYD